MLHYLETAKTKTPEIAITKSIGSLIFVTSLQFEAITNESITIWIERVNGSNVYLAQSVRLSDFLMATNFGQDALQSNSEFPTIALCELSADGAIQLNEGESLKFKMDNLKSAATYGMYSVEDPILTSNFSKFDRKTLGADELDKVIDVRNAELAIIDLHETLKELLVRYDNGTVVKYTPFELGVITRDLDPIFQVFNDGTVSQGHSTKLIMPVIGVDSIQFIKDAGTVIQMTVVRTENLFEQE